MACINPIPINNENGIIHAPCNKCRECKVQRIKDWSFRLQSELKNCYNALFVTLTYEANIPELSESHLRAFLKNLRNFQSYRRKRSGNKTKLKFIAVGEYGEHTNRPHYHLIIFNYLPSKEDKLWKSRIHKELFETWGKGIVHIGDVETASINYVCKYVFKQDYIKITSKNIGMAYIDKMADYHRKDLSRLHGIINTKRFRLPPYIKNKIFSKQDKQYQGAVIEAENDLKRLELFKDAKTSIGYVHTKFRKIENDNLIHKIKQNEKQAI